jgi:hypothetical protein
MIAGERTQRGLSLCIVVATGLVMGFFVWKTDFDYLPALYPLAFKQGQWITTAAETPQGYFRKELYLSSNPLHAQVMVAATDSFALYVNGRTVDAKAQAFLHVSGIYDIGPYLRAGKNVIALASRKLTYPGPAKVALEGLWFDQAGREHVISSDSSWKASSHEDSQSYGRISWYAQEFSADAWPPSQTSGIPSPAEVAPVPIHPDLLRVSSYGQWIGHADSRQRLAIFSHAFEVPRRVQGAWVRVAAIDSYKLTINSIPVASSAAPKPTFDIYDISPFLKKGMNTIAVSVAAIKGSSAQLLLDSIVAEPGHTQPILATSSAWTASGPGIANGSPAIVLTSSPSAIARLIRKPSLVSVPISYIIVRIIRMLAVIGVLLSLTLIFWKGSSRLLCHINPDINSDRASAIDAILHLPSVSLLVAVYLLQYDTRFDASFTFQEKFIYLSYGVLFVLRVITFFNNKMHFLTTLYLQLCSLRISFFNPKNINILLIICLVMITVSGMLLRLHGLDSESLSHDEAGLPIRAKEVLQRGYPVNIIGPVEKPVTTYELLPYPIALSIALFGATDFAVRLPAAMFGTLTILLIFHIGRRLWGASTGILAAMIYAFSPFALTWGSNAFHPQQTQFFALLTSYVFYRSLISETEVIDRKYLYGASLCFILTYLSWEPAALLLPTLFIGLLAVKGRDLRWLKSRHLWLSVLIVCAVIFLQLCYRILSNVPYIVVGKGLSDTTITLFFLNPLYDPWFYLETFLFSGIHTPMTVMLIIGLPLICKYPYMTYYFIVLCTPLLLMTNFLPNQSIRYIYFLQPYLILLSSSVCIYIVFLILSFEKQRFISSIVVVKVLIFIILPLSLFLSTNTFLLKLYNLGYSRDWITQMLSNAYDIDYRSTAHFLQKNMRSDDVVISLMPHTFDYYISRKSDYYLQTYTNRQVFYDVSETSGNYLDKYIGSPVIRNFSELMDVMSRHRRIWIMATPHTIFELTNDRQVLGYIKEHSKVMYESYKSRVYLWQH